MFRGLIALLFVLIGMSSMVKATEASSLPPWPVIFSGAVTIAGQPAPDGSKLTAKMTDAYTSFPVTVKDGRYVGLAVGGPDASFLQKTITFHLDGALIAAETYVFGNFQAPKLVSPFDLTFPAYPTPTPGPTATVVPATAPPVALSPMVLSGVVEVDLGEASDLEGKEVVARVGSYFSDVTTLVANYGLLTFEGLIVDPQDPKFSGMEISIIVDGIQTGGNIVLFSSGANTDVALRIEVPATPTAIPDAPAVPVEPETPTAIPATSTPAALAPVPAPPAAVPTAAPIPTAVPVVVPTAVVSSTSTPEPIVGEIESEESGGGCGLPGPVSRGTAAVNSLMLFAPLLLIAGYRGVKRRKR